MARTKNKARRATGTVRIGREALQAGVKELTGGQQVEKSRKTGGANTGNRNSQFDEVGSLTPNAIKADDEKILAELGAIPGLGFKEDPLFVGHDEEDADGDEWMPPGGDSIGAEDEDELDAIEHNLLESDDRDAELSDDDDNDENGEEEEPKAEKVVEAGGTPGIMQPSSEKGTCHKENAVSAAKKKGYDVEDPEQKKTMDIGNNTDPVSAPKEDVSMGDTKETEEVKMDITGNVGSKSSPNEGPSEVKRRQWRARKRNREVAFEYWSWSPAPADLKESKAAAKELVEQNMCLEWKCEICDFSARGGEEIDNHLWLKKHERVLAEHLRDAVLLPRVPGMLKIREEYVAHRVLIAHIKELKGAKRAGVKVDVKEVYAQMERKAVKRCELCDRDFIRADGYEGHIRGQKHLKKAAKASTCNDDFVN